MKNLFTLFATLFCVQFLFAQSFVSTTAENKNVILEEFTGIHCGYCPDGHVQAQNFSNANPGDVVVINLHTGSFANPSPGEPDFRTPLGPAIDAQAGVAGYPAGTINRHLFPGMQQGTGTAMSRGDWATAGGQTLAQPSCVNVAAEAYLDIQTRVLTVDVEAYYTDNSAVSSNKMNVVLLQNNVEGPQANGAVYNPGAMLPNGMYNHQHMFRHMLTGQWGDDILTTTTGSFFQNTYTYTIPPDLNGVMYDLFNLEVAVFVSEGNQEILSGNMGNMTHVVPNGVNLVDLGTTTNMTMPASLCDNNLTPEITITNLSAIAVDTFAVNYTLNSGTPVTQNVYTSLAPGANTTITFPAVTVPSGSNTISYYSSMLAGTSYIDNIPNNNGASSGAFNIISPVAFATALGEGFEGFPNQTPTPSNSLLLNPQNHRVFIIDPTWPGPNAGGFGNSHNLYRWTFIDGWAGGDYATLVFAKLDFSASVGHAVMYSYSHAQTNGFDNNRLQVLVSTDCGATWNLESELIGSALATTSPMPSGPFYPNASIWGSDLVDLSAYDGNSEVMIAFKGICAGGNNLYIDDIEVGPGMVSTTSWDCHTASGTCFDPGTGLGQYSTLNACQQSCVAVSPSWDCVNNTCIDPGTGLGQYSTLNACQQVCASTDINENISEGDFILFPNPITNKGTLQLNIQKSTSLEIGIYNVLGKKVQQIDNTKFTKGIHNITFDTSNLESGTYFLKYESDDDVNNIKFVVTH